MKAERDEIAEGADRTSAVRRAHHERRVLDDANAMPARESIERVHVDERAGPVRRHDRARPRPDPRLDLAQVDVARHQVAVDEYRRRAAPDDHVQHGEEALRAGDDLVAFTDVAEL